MLPLPLILLTGIIVPLGAGAFSFTISSPPVQCETLTIDWSGGAPPYEVTILPIDGGGGINSQWVREIVDTNTTATSYTFQLLLPEQSQFALVLSDATGFGMGGTSGIYTVGNNTDSSCLLTSLAPTDFSFTLLPDPPSQCDDVEFTFAGNTSDSVIISIVIPGGNSTRTNPIILDDHSSLGWVIERTLDVRNGTEVAFMVGDSRGKAVGGRSALMRIGPGITTCLDSKAASTTAAPPAGAISTSGASSGSSSSSSSNKGAIAGGVVGGIAALLLIGLVACVLLRRHNRSRAPSAKAIALKAWVRARSSGL